MDSTPLIIHSRSRFAPSPVRLWHIATAAFALATPTVLAQQRLWELAGGDIRYNTVDAFVDYNGDGYTDLLAGVVVGQYLPTGYSALRVLSGLDGSTLFERPSSSVLRAVGDWDQDGHRDYIAYGNGNGTYPVSMEVRSFVSGQILTTIYGPSTLGNLVFDTNLAADLDLTGDGRPDLVAATATLQQSVVYAYSNAGTLLYQIPLHPYRWVANNVTAMPDLDGDGSQDFLVGCNEPSGRGAIVVVSGRTGALLRVSYGVLPGDAIGGSVCNAGDMDRDGIPEYAGSSYWSSPLFSTVVFSGRTGAVLQNHTDWVTLFNGLTGNVDVDLDGVPDLIVGNNPIRAYSGRDGSVLWNFSNTTPQLLPFPVFPVGVQPGSPYPVLACVDRTNFGGGSSINHVIAFRANLVGAGPVSGSGCSSSGIPPQIGMHSVPGHVRMTVSNGPSGALAWLVGCPASQNAFGVVTLPYALDSFGLFGCTALVAPVVVAPTLLGSVGIDRGHGFVDLPWPALSPTGMAFAAQWLLLDPTTGAYAVSARHDFRVP